MTAHFSTHKTFAGEADGRFMQQTVGVRDGDGQRDVAVQDLRADMILIQEHWGGGKPSEVLETIETWKKALDKHVNGFFDALSTPDAKPVPAPRAAKPSARPTGDLSKIEVWF